MEANTNKHSKMSVSIVNDIITMLTEGKLKQGNKLPPERIMAEQFGVSRATLREALSALEVVGIIDMRVGEGSFITDLNIVPFIRMISRLFVRTDSMENELLDLRKLLEIEAVRLILKRNITREDLEILNEKVDLMEQGLFRDDVELGVKADVQFHQALFELSNNHILQKAGDCISLMLENSVRFNRTKILMDENNMELLYNQHHLIYKAILQKDEDVAVRTLTKHLDWVKATF